MLAQQQHHQYGGEVEDDLYYDEEDPLGEQYEYANPAEAAQYYAQQQQMQMQGYTADSQDFDSSGGEALIQQGFRILKEELPPDYEPSHEEIVQYAEYLGMDPIADKDLLYIAKEGLKAPLPAPWKPCQ